MFKNQDEKKRMESRGKERREVNAFNCINSQIQRSFTPSLSLPFLLVCARRLNVVFSHGWLIDVCMCTVPSKEKRAKKITSIYLMALWRWMAAIEYTLYNIQNRNSMFRRISFRQYLQKMATFIWHYDNEKVDSTLQAYFFTNFNREKNSQLKCTEHCALVAIYPNKKLGNSKTMHAPNPQLQLVCASTK